MKRYGVYALIGIIFGVSRAIADSAAYAVVRNTSPLEVRMILTGPTGKIAVAMIKPGAQISLENLMIPSYPFTAQAQIVTSGSRMDTACEGMIYPSFVPTRSTGIRVDIGSFRLPKNGQVPCSLSQIPGQA